MDKKSFFEPPYDSPIEEQFAWHFTKYVHPDIELLTQYEIPTNHGTFKLDFAIQVNNKIIGIECDGKEFHNIWRDVWRDIAVIENSIVSEVFRFRGCDITYHINECLIVLSWYYPDLFDSRGIENINRLADKEVLNEDFYKERNMSLIEFAYKGFDEEFNTLIVWRINERYYNNKNIARQLKADPSLTIDQLYEKHKINLI